MVPWSACSTVDQQLVGGSNMPCAAAVLSLSPQCSMTGQIKACRQDLVCPVVSVRLGIYKIPCHLSKKSRASCPDGRVSSSFLHQ